jgi:hypothetical protein
MEEGKQVETAVSCRPAAKLSMVLFCGFLMMGECSTLLLFAQSPLPNGRVIPTAAGSGRTSASASSNAALASSWVE